jgi:hypothetical protein
MWRVCVDGKGDADGLGYLLAPLFGASDRLAPSLPVAEPWTMGIGAPTRTEA